MSSLTISKADDAFVSQDLWLEPLNSPRNVVGVEESHYLMFLKRLQGGLSGDSFLKKVEQINKQLPHTHVVILLFVPPAQCTDI